jgi:protein TonB
MMRRPGSRRTAEGGRVTLAGSAMILAAAAACGPKGPIEAPELQAGQAPVEYPVELWDMGLEGETTLMVHVTAGGAVDSVYVHQSSGFEDFDSAAVAGGMRMRFAPARRGGERIDMWTRVPVRFQREPQ